MAGSRSGRTFIAAFVVGVVALGCSPAASPSLSAAAPSAVASAAGIVLDRTEPIGCDTIGIDYKSATIKIDAASDPDVWAETETGKKLAVKWTAGFTAGGRGGACDPWTEGRRGRPRRDEDRRPGGRQLSRLVGYFVCLAPDALYILEDRSAVGPGAAVRPPAARAPRVRAGSARAVGPGRVLVGDAGRGSEPRPGCDVRAGRQRIDRHRDTRRDASPASVVPRSGAGSICRSIDPPSCPRWSSTSATAAVAGSPHQRILWATAGYAHFVMDSRGQGSSWAVGVTAGPRGDRAPGTAGIT